MNGYPIVHTKNNPIKLEVIASSATEVDIEKDFHDWLSDKDYVEIHDIKVVHEETSTILYVLHKEKYQGEVV